MKVTGQRWSTYLLVKGACIIGLCAIGLMMWSILFPYALPVIAAMSVAQGLGILAFLFYLGAIVTEVKKHDAKRAVAPPSERPKSP